MGSNGSKPTPYIEHHPGDLITAEDWNSVQLKVQTDLQKRIADAIEDVLHGSTPVDHALDAEKFDHKSSKNWTDELDQRYALKVHDHEGMASYRRYFRRLEKDPPFVILEHKLGRIPLVDVYQMLPIAIPVNLSSTNAETPISAEFLLYYGHEENDLLQSQPAVTAGKKLPKRSLGTPWEQLLLEYEVKYEDDNSFSDVINDFYDAFFSLPAADDMDHEVSKWVAEHADKKTIGELKQKDEWGDLRWLMLPRKVAVGEFPLVLSDPPTISANTLDVIHLNYNTLALRTIDATFAIDPDKKPPDGEEKINLMIILRS